MWFLAQIAPNMSESEWIRQDYLGLTAAIYGGLLLVGLIVGIGLLLYIYRHPIQWSRRVNRLIARPWNWRDLFRIIVLLVIVNACGSLLITVLHSVFEFPDFMETGEVVVQSLFTHWAGVILVGFSLYRRRISWRLGFGCESQRVWRMLGMGVLIYLATLPLIWFYSMIYQLCLYFAGYESTLQDVAWILTNNAGWLQRIYLFTLAIVIAPVVEELLFRGIGLPLLVRKFGAAWGIIIVSALFALVHLHLPSLFPLFLVGVTLAIAYICSESILVPIVIHSLFNGVSIYLLVLLRGT